MVLSLQSQLNHTEPPAVYGLQLGEYAFAIRLHDGRIEIARGAAEHPDAVIATAPRTLDDLVTGNRSLAALVRSGEATVTGDPEAAERFASYFTPAPSPVARADQTRTALA